MEVVRIRLCFLTAGAYAARHMARHMGHPPESRHMGHPPELARQMGHPPE